MNWKNNYVYWLFLTYIFRSHINMLKKKYINILKIESKMNIHEVIS